jgi:FkbH-like protein
MHLGIFLDDDVLERQLVSTTFPNMLTPHDPYQFASVLERLEMFGRLGVGTEEDKIRLQSTRASDALKRAPDRALILGSLGMEIWFEDLHSSNKDRAHQLADRVTQMRTGPTPNAWGDEKTHVFLVGLSEAAANHGRVGLVMWHREGDCAHIDLLCLSCRALNRDLELAMLAEMARRAAMAGLTFISGSISPSLRNQPAQDLYLKAGFTRYTQDVFKQHANQLSMPKHFNLTTVMKSDEHTQD